MDNDGRSVLSQRCCAIEQNGRIRWAQQPGESKNFQKFRYCYFVLSLRRLPSRDRTWSWRSPPLIDPLAMWDPVDMCKQLQYVAHTQPPIEYHPLAPEASEQRYRPELGRLPAQICPGSNLWVVGVQKSPRRIRSACRASEYARFRAKYCACSRRRLKIGSPKGELEPSTYSQLPSPATCGESKL